MKHFGLLLFILFGTLDAHAVLVDPMYRVAIKTACLRNTHGPNANAFCGCVGTRHFKSAKQMPNYSRANQDLKWVLKYYRAKDAATLARLRANPDNLVTYDAYIGAQCRKESRS